MSLKSTIDQRMLELGIEPKKSLGQNFLVSEFVVNRILQALKDFKPGSIIEVGPGLGSLTSGMIQLNLPFQVVELDRKFAEYWRSQAVTVFEADALQMDWSLFIGSSPQILVSNLPYQISSSLVIDRCLDTRPLDGMILMFQKEVAQKIKGDMNSGHYGMLSVMAQTFWQVELLLEASSGDFYPPPKVASRVLTFRPRKNEVKNPVRYLKFLKACFLHPRKLMASNVKEALGIEKAVLHSVFQNHGLSDKVRAQEASQIQFVQMATELGYV